MVSVSESGPRGAGAAGGNNSNGWSVETSRGVRLSVERNSGPDGGAQFQQKKKAIISSDADARKKDRKPKDGYNTAEKEV